MSFKWQNTTHGYWELTTGDNKLLADVYKVNGVWVLEYVYGGGLGCEGALAVAEKLKELNNPIQYEVLP